MDYNYQPNYGYNPPFNQPMGFDTFGQVNFHNTPYSQQPQDSGFNFPDAGPTQNYNSNGNMFAAFDHQDNYNNYGSYNSSGQDSFNFPSNMASTNHTSNFMAQFNADPKNQYNNSRASCPVTIKSSSTLDYK